MFYKWQKKVGENVLAKIKRQYLYEVLMKNRHSKVQKVASCGVSVII